MIHTASFDAWRATLAPPDGFVERRLWGGHLWVRAGFESRLPLGAGCLRDGFLRTPGMRTFQGRGSCYSIPLGAREGAVLRHYRHGGLLASLTGDVFWGPTPRPLAELRVSEELRRRGVLTPEILAMFWSYKGLGFYVADLVTREVPGSMDLHRFLSETVRDPRRRRLRRCVLAEAGRTIWHTHEAGLDHPDLNLRNLLVRETQGRPEVWVLDLDKARIVDPLPDPLRLGQLLRLERSLLKLARQEKLADVRDRLVFLRSYGGGSSRTLLSRMGRIA